MSNTLKRSSIHKEKLKEMDIKTTSSTIISGGSWLPVNWGASASQNVTIWKVSESGHNVLAHKLKQSKRLSDSEQSIQTEIVMVQLQWGHTVSVAVPLWWSKLHLLEWQKQVQMIVLSSNQHSTAWWSAWGGDRVNTNMGSSPQGGKRFFSESRLPVQISLKCVYSPGVQLYASTSGRMLKIPNTGSHTTVWRHKNTAFTALTGRNV